MKHHGTHPLETQRLLLRRFTLDDIQSIFKNWASDEKVTKYLSWSTHQTVKDSAGFIHSCVQNYSDNAFYQ